MPQTGWEVSDASGPHVHAHMQISVHARLHDPADMSDVDGYSAFDSVETCCQEILFLRTKVVNNMPHITKNNPFYSNHTCFTYIPLVAVWKYYTNNQLVQS